MVIKMMVVRRCVKCCLSVSSLIPTLSSLMQPLQVPSQAPTMRAGAAAVSSPNRAMLILIQTASNTTHTTTTYTTHVIPRQVFPNIFAASVICQPPDLPMPLQ
ncbi:hypothetical protein EDB19DRAFT_1698346, partial [Suillus lakei]